MQWPALLHLLFTEYRGPRPHVLVIHLGGNDLGLVSGRALVLQVLADLQVIRQRWPGTRIIWSAIVPRFEWRHAWDPRAMHKARRNANREIGRALQRGLGLYLPHPDIGLGYPELYRTDGVHLSEAGLDRFLHNIQQGLAKELGLEVGASA